MEILNLKRLKISFKAAFEGLRVAISEQTFRLLCVCALVVLILMFVFKLSFSEKIIIIFLVTLILTFELINSQIEKILDFLQPNRDSRVKVIKDVSAGAVLIACLGALIIGILVFCH